MANRIWYYHFGRGIVNTPSDFGLKGDRPGNPQLLDWLASEFVKEGWSLKALHRLIMTSNTYQQASDSNEASAKADPDDTLFWRFPRHRLEGETIRDAMLAVSGRLNPKMGGPSIFPELPPGMQSRGGWSVNKDVTERDRRSICVFVRRNTRYPMFETFDMPDTHESCSRRNVTTSPLQALTMLNSALTLNWAQSFADRVMRTAGENLDRQIEMAYRMAFSRMPSREEKETVQNFFDRQRAILAERRSSGEKLAEPIGVMPVDAAQGAALVDFCHTLLNANEFVYCN
jgi:hypothetical protein